MLRKQSRNAKAPMKHEAVALAFTTWLDRSTQFRQGLRDLQK